MTLLHAEVWYLSAKMYFNLSFACAKLAYSKEGVCNSVYMHLLLVLRAHIVQRYKGERRKQKVEMRKQSFVSMSSVRQTQ